MSAGNESAMCNLAGLAIFYEEDYEKAMNLYKQATDVGDELSMYNIASMYEYGMGVSLDYKKALAWYREAAKNGDEYMKEDVKEAEQRVKFKMGGGKDYSWFTVKQSCGGERC